MINLEREYRIAELMLRKAQEEEYDGMEEHPECVQPVMLLKDALLTPMGKEEESQEKYILASGYDPNTTYVPVSFDDVNFDQQPPYTKTTVTANWMYGSRGDIAETPVYKDQKGNLFTSAC